MGSAPSTGSAEVSARRGGRGGGCRWVVVSEDVQPLNQTDQGALPVEREVSGLCFAWRQSCGELMRSLAKWA